MAFLTWSRDFEMGIPEMDEQHKKWLDLLNAFYIHIGNDDFQERMVELIDGVLSYTKYHFSEEEALMASINYPAIGEQRSMHGDIVKRIEEFKTKAGEGKLIISMPLTAELKKWFKEHILIEDMKYAQYLKENR